MATSLLPASTVVPYLYLKAPLQDSLLSFPPPGLFLNHIGVFSLARGTRELLTAIADCLS